MVRDMVYLYFAFKFDNKLNRLFTCLLVLWTVKPLLNDKDFKGMYLEDKNSYRQKNIIFKVHYRNRKCVRIKIFILYSSI